MNSLKRFYNPTYFLGMAVCCGLIAGYLNQPSIYAFAGVVSEIFINLLKLISLPIIFLSIVSTASGMESVDEIKTLGKKVLQYTLLTTVLAATVALILFVVIDPVKTHLALSATPFSDPAIAKHPGYLNYLIQIIPSNIVQPFSENNVIGVLFIAMLLSFASLSLPNENRKSLHSFFSSLYAAIMKITTWLVAVMPLAIWAFITLFIRDLQEGLEIKSLALYLTVVISANLVQAFVVLPILLKLKQISPLTIAKGMFPALSVAFFTKSSNAALPMAMKCAQENVGIAPKIASFTLPLCTTINMNGCAAFILTTVLFVSMSNGMTYTPAEMIVWIFISTVAAVGNAGVPMGCYFLASAFLAAMNVPLNILGVILPFYTLIDMVETAINVWSDSCVATLAHRDIMGQAPSPATTSLNISLETPQEA